MDTVRMQFLVLDCVKLPKQFLKKWDRPTGIFEKSHKGGEMETNTLLHLAWPVFVKLYQIVCSKQVEYERFDCGWH